MKAVVSCIEQLRLKLDRHRKDDLKEYPTRTIFIDPMLQALGWDVRDPEDVQLEYPTVDGKSVDYAPKVNKRPVLFIEAKALNDPLTDVKAITQVVGYAANAGVEWCILTNGVTYRVYRSTEKAEAPDKLLFEVSINPKAGEGKSTQQIAEQLNRFSRDSMENGILNTLGIHVFTAGKIRRALDKLFTDPPSQLIKIIRSAITDDSIKPNQIKEILPGIWLSSPIAVAPAHEVGSKKVPSRQTKRTKTEKEYGEEHHLEGVPKEVVELYHTLDRYCLDLAMQGISKQHRLLYIAYRFDNKIFASIHVQKGGLRVYVKLDFAEIDNALSNVRNVKNIGHWGVGDVEIAVDNGGQLLEAKRLIKQSFDRNRQIMKLGS